MSEERKIPSGLTSVPEFRYGVVLMEKPLDSGLTRAEVNTLFEKLMGVEAIPIEIQGEHSTAMGFINLTDAEFVGYNYTLLESVVKKVLNDMEEEHEDHVYSYPHTSGITTIWLDR